LEEENATLQAEYERLRAKQTPGSTPEESSHLPGGQRAPDCDMLAEAKLLRQHKGRLEARMQILEDHNRQLEAQLQRLRQLLDEVNAYRLSRSGSRHKWVNNLFRCNGWFNREYLLLQLLITTYT